MLALDEVSVVVGSALLLDRVSFDVAPGEVVALLGPNGAGKSTVLGVAAGDHQTSTGGVRLQGRALHEWTPLERARLRAVLPQQSSLRFGFSVLEVVLLGRSPFGGRDPKRDLEVARQSLEEVDLLGLEHRAYTTLSGGERQRVHLARVLAQLDGSTVSTPRLLLLDEPISALDLVHQHRTLLLLKTLATANVGTLIVLHDLNLAAQYADRVIIMNKGLVRAIGVPGVVIEPALIADVFGMRVEIVRTAAHDFPIIVPVAIESRRN